MSMKWIKVIPTTRIQRSLQVHNRTTFKNSPANEAVLAKILHSQESKHACNNAFAPKVEVQTKIKNK